MPCNEDILNMRVTTWAVSDTEFLIKNQNLHIYDVSGLKYHRKSWLQYFDHVNNIMFLASLSGYSQVLPEDPTVNRLVDSIVLFGDMVNHKLIKHIDIILFLNKIDLFKRKVKKVPISKFFPEYSG